MKVYPFFINFLLLSISSGSLVESTNIENCSILDRLNWLVFGVASCEGHNVLYRIQLLESENELLKRYILILEHGEKYHKLQLEAEKKQLHYCLSNSMDQKTNLNQDFCNCTRNEENLLMNLLSYWKNLWISSLNQVSVNKPATVLYVEKIDMFLRQLKSSLGYYGTLFCFISISLFVLWRYAINYLNEKVRNSIKWMYQILLGRRVYLHEEPCTICLEKMQEYIFKQIVLPCGHCFHPECISKWLQESSDQFGNVYCPVCKLIVPLSFVKLLDEVNFATGWRYTWKRLKYADSLFQDLIYIGIIFFLVCLPSVCLLRYLLFTV